MTTIVFSRPHGKIVADSRNTDSAGAVFKVRKIERLDNGRYFLGAGHLYTIGLARDWAESDFSEDERPDFDVLYGDQGEDFAFSCLVISEDGRIAVLIDDEMQPQAVQDDFLAVGSGAAYAIGALEAGADPEEAVEIAISRDGNSGGPIQVEVIGPRLQAVK